ncbi:MAG: molybdopterin synthase [Sulfobacillus acidophilus]|uniref:Molybdopterin synthase n=1 Tax=Sulfobacillus acidophilus TaxID=53633 RepID=A0A2T2WJK3_9FIRM|nr:MAG: molybdopterin synthase [Sulfobacillus acidophilus]
MDIVRIQDVPIDVNEGIAAIIDERAGGEAIFLGTVRNVFEGRASRGLFYEAYRDLAEKEMKRIEEELKREFDVLHVVMVHRIGELALGEIAVMVAVSAAHRHQAIRACEAGIDRIKSRVPIWKKERWADGKTAWHDDPEAGAGQMR